MLSGPCPSLGPGVVATGKSMFGHVFATLSISSGEQLVSHTRPRKIGSCHHCATDRGGATQAALLVAMARGLAAWVPLRLGQPLGAFPELEGGRSCDGAAVCSTRTLCM